ncbi:ATP-binding protein [Catenovulum sp. 2E275]|uniref:ATP-binding protein n=1 Tax=Catenovulum sp. 2E275 TaxID=2980497 RepID=UPI0021CEBF5E|nr:ATP-binding protein [Catenovulum sp. 2E275]MCU4677062.1 ATP-binding protein [Catenovulum sp. 2E275]
MRSLQRIILIDTHLPGVVELKLNGHTNICGTNASGKTTLQRLIPVFYGEFPSRVVPSTRDSFERWYLPRESSFIIYEYLRGEGQSCQAVLSSSGSGVNYRLISKAFELEDYLQTQPSGELKPVTMVELGRNLKRAGINQTSLLNTSQFRAIIQNDRSQLNSSSNNRELLGYARLYSLCENDSSLRHIEKLAKAVHSKEGKMETIKAMVSAILEEDGVQPPSSKLNVAKVDEWIKECQLIQGFDAIKPEFNQLEQSHKQLQKNEQRLSELKQHYALDLSKLSKVIIENQSLLEETTLDLRQLENKWQHQRDKLNQSISSAKADVNQYEQDLEQVEQDYFNWQDKDIEALKQKLTDLPRWQSELQSAQSRYQLLTEKHSDIESAFNKRLAEISEKYSEEIEAYRSEKDEKAEDLAEQKHQSEFKLQQLKQDFIQQIQTIKNEYSEALHQLEKQQAELNVEIKHTGFNVNEQTELDLFDAQIKEASLAEDISREELTALEQTAKQAQKNRQQADETLAKARQLSLKKEQQVEAVEALLYPGEHTLLEFLRKQRPEWEQDLGKVIHPDLLKRTDLAPALSEQPNNESVYNLLLDLNALDTPEYAESEQALKAKLNLAQNELETAQNQQDEAELELAKANEELTLAERKISEFKIELTNKTQTRKRLQQDKDALISQYQHAVAERKIQIEKRLNAVKASQQAQTSELDACIAEVADQQAEAELEHKAHWQQLIADTQQQIEQINLRISQSQNAVKQDKKQANIWLENELAKRDVDVDEIGKLKQQIAKLTQDINFTEKNRNLVSDYLHWYKSVYNGHKLKWQAELNQAKQDLTEAERQLSRQGQNYQQAREQKTQQQTELEQIVRDAKTQENDLQLINRLLSKLKLPPANVVKESGNLAQRISQGQELLTEREQLQADIKQQLDRFDTLIASQSGSGLAEIWEKSREECSQLNSSGILVLDHRKLVEKLAELIHVFVPQRLQGLRDQGKIFGKDLSSYYQVLADIDKRIASQSSRISKEVDEELYLEGVSDSAVKIRSKISELEFWPELKNFQQLYLEWIEQGAHELPTQDYAQSIKRALDIIGRSALSGGISKLLDIELTIKEGNSTLVIRTDRQLNESSSHGMAYLILCKFLLAFTRLLRGQSKAVIHWPIDELGTLHQSNVKKIFTACEQNNIAIVGAFPNPESEVLSLFDNRYLIDKASKKLQVVQPRLNPISARIKARQTKAQATEQTDKSEPVLNQGVKA